MYSLVQKQRASYRDEWEKAVVDVIGVRVIGVDVIDVSLVVL